MVAAVLAACGQGPQEVAKARGTQSTQPTQPEQSNVEEADPGPQTLKPITEPPTTPEGGAPNQPVQPEVVQPTEVKPSQPEQPEEVVKPTTPRVPPPGQSELSEAELIARKLISTDPNDNLEVRVANPVLHILFPPSEHVVQHNHLVALHHEPVHQV